MLPTYCCHVAILESCPECLEFAAPDNLRKRLRDPPRLDDLRPFAGGPGDDL